MDYESMTITAANGIPFTVRILREGERYGVEMCKVHTGPGPMVEFYDARFDNERFHRGLGQFVSRYDARTLLGIGEWSTPRVPGTGIALDGGVPDWRIDGKSMDRVITWLSEQVAAEPSAGPKLG